MFFLDPHLFHFTEHTNCFKYSSTKYLLEKKKKMKNFVPFDRYSTIIWPMKFWPSQFGILNIFYTAAIHLYSSIAMLLCITLLLYHLFSLNDLGFYAFKLKWCCANRLDSWDWNYLKKNKWRAHSTISIFSFSFSLSFPSFIIFPMQLIYVDSISSAMFITKSCLRPAKNQF